MIKEIREELQISREELCQGLCHVNTLANMEVGGEAPPKWLTDVFLERLGMSPNQFGCHQGWKEEEEYQRKRRILLYLKEEEKEKLGQLIKETEQEWISWKGRRYPECSEQFLMYVRLVKEGYLESGQIQELEKRTIAAIRMTVPAFSGKLPGEEKSGEKSKMKPLKYHFGRMEWALTVLLADLRFCQSNKREEGKKLYRRILLQMPEQMRDVVLLRECYPYVMAMFLIRLQESGDSSGCWLAQKGIEFWGNGQGFMDWRQCWPMRYGV